MIKERRKRRGPTGATGAQGPTGATGPAGTPFALGTPVAAAAVLGTARQAADSTKPALISTMVRADYSLTVAGNLTDTVEIRIGATAAAAQGGAGGIQVAECVFGVTGIALTVGLGIQQQNQMTAHLPAGWFFCVRRTAGTRAAIVTTMSQPLS